MSKPSVTVIIPSTGALTLEQCVKSVQEQTYDNVKPYVVFDGYPFVPPGGTMTGVSVLDELTQEQKIDYSILPYNVGANGWYGHRIFAAFSYLVNTEYVCFLDQDNWFEPNHIETLMDTVYNRDWVYSLRNIVDLDGEFICRDDCESLGMWPIWTHNEKTAVHIDTSCFLIKREVLTSGVAGAWYGRWAADRQFFATIRQYYPNYDCSGHYTVNYRLGGNTGSVTKDFFDMGNKYMAKNYKNKFPWAIKK